MAGELVFVSYGQAYLLNKLGFNYPIHSYYCTEPFFGTDFKGRYQYHKGDIVCEHDVCKSIEDNIIPRWAVDQVIRWFTVEYNINIEISKTAFNTYFVEIIDESDEPLFCPIKLKKEFGTHIDAELGAISKVLKELIEHNPSLYDEYVDDLFNGEMNCNE